MAKISELPQATESKSTDVIPIVQDGRTKQIARPLLIPRVPDGIKFADNALQLMEGDVPIGQGVPIKKTPVLLDTFTIAEGEEPVAFYQLSLANQGWTKILISGTIQSDDTTSIKRQLQVGTSAGFHYCRPPAEDFSAAKTISVNADRMANGYLRARTVISTHTYTLGTLYENPGRKPVTDWGCINGVYLIIIGAQFAAGTSFEIWGVE